MSEVSKSVLKAKLLEYLRRVEETGEELVVTDNGRPVVKVVPHHARRRPARDLFADVRGHLIDREDVLTPTTDEWPES